MSTKTNEYKKIATQARRAIIDVKYPIRSSHIGTAFSCVDILTVLYNHPSFRWIGDERDFFIMSKAHGSVALYATLYLKGTITKKEFFSLNKDGSYFGDHVSKMISGIEYSLGSLGHGLSVAAGAAHALKMDESKRKVIVLLGDGECNEGMIWEAASYAPIHELDNLIAIVDFNGWQGYGRTEEFSRTDKLTERWESFGWKVLMIDGHNFEELQESFQKGFENDNLPTLIIAKTIKGKGVSFMEDTLEWHYKSLQEEQYYIAKEELK